MPNRLVLSGTVCRAPETRTSPAGIPLTRFTLEHRSRQIEAGVEREATCRIVVVAAGESMRQTTVHLREGAHVTVSGFISRADARQGQAMLVLHAQQIETDTERASATEI